MPSVPVANHLSGGHCFMSGGIYSGFHVMPVTGVQIRADRNNSGNIYIGLSGGLTITSGSYPLSGGLTSGMLDGLQLGPGDSAFYPKLCVQAISGFFNLFASCDAVASGFSRVYWEVL